MARPSKPLITRELAVQEALGLIDADGLDAFSIPRLASRMGVRAPSLYHHFHDRHELLAEVSKAIIRETPIPRFRRDSSWQDWCLTMTLDVRRAVLRHRHAAPLIIRYLPRDTLTELYERASRYLTQEGVPVADQLMVLDALERIALGAVIVEAIRTTHEDGALFPKVSADRHPSLTRTIDGNTRSAEDLYRDMVVAFLAGLPALAESVPWSAEPAETV